MVFNSRGTPRDHPHAVGDWVPRLPSWLRSQEIGEEQKKAPAIRLGRQSLFAVIT